MIYEFDTVVTCLEHHAVSTPDALLVRHGDRELSYGLALDEVRHLARALLERGISHGDRFAVYANPHAEALLLFLAAASIGAVFVGLSPKQTSSEISHVLSTTSPRLLFVIGSFDAEHVEKFSQVSTDLPTVVVLGVTQIQGAVAYEEFRKHVAEQSALELARRRVVAQDPVAVVFTSGSAGRPKGALLTNGPMMLAYAVQARHWYREDVPPQGVADLPINHLGFVADNCMAVLPAGGGVSILEKWTPEAVLDLIARNRITFWWTQTTLLQLTTESAAWAHADLSSVDLIGFAGAPVNKRMLALLRETGIPLATSYGMTEVHGNCTYTDMPSADEELLETIGRPNPRFDVTVIDESGRQCPPGAVGEIVVRGPSLCGGYLMADGSVEDIRSGDGWYHTKDLGSLRPDGNLSLVGRSDHMFKSGGFNVYPREIENVLESHPNVRAAVVVGVPEDKWGRVGRAFVLVSDASLDVHELRAFARESLANYKVPKEFILGTEFPMLASGKIDRNSVASSLMLPLHYLPPRVITPTIPRQTSDLEATP